MVTATRITWLGLWAPGPCHQQQVAEDLPASSRHLEDRGGSPTWGSGSDTSMQDVGPASGLRPNSRTMCR